MTGAEFRALREHAGITREQVAERAGLPPRDVDAWERGGRLPYTHQRKLDWALWWLERELALAHSPIPECTAVDLAHPPPPGDKAAVSAFITHVETCPLCTARANYVREHVRPEPITGGLLGHVLGYGARLSGWHSSAYYGAAFLLGMGGMGVVLLLGIGLITLNPAYIGAAFALFLVLAISGAVGGITHYATASLRGRGTVGHYFSSVLVVYAYFAAVLILFTLGSVIAGRPLDPRLARMTADPVGWISFGVAGIVFGIVLGRAMR